MPVPIRPTLVRLAIAVATSLGGAICNAVAASSGAPSGGGIVLYVTMDVIPPWGYGDDCGTLDAASITANVGDHVHLCYIGLNNTAQTLTLHSLSNDVDGDLFTNFEVVIPPGNQQNLAELRFTVQSTRDLVHTWTASDGAGGDVSTTTTQTHLEALAPQVQATPAAIEATVAAGAIVLQPLAIASVGTADLDWHLGESEGTGGTQAAPAVQRAPGPGASDVRTRGTTPSVPAFAVEIGTGGTRYVALDLAQPDVVQPVATDSLPDVAAGAFVDGEETRELLLSDSAGLLALDTRTGALETINPNVAPDMGDLGWRGMAWDARTDMLYALSTDGTLPTLYSIDPQTGDVTRIGAINDRTVTVNGVYSAIAVDSDGRIFAIDETNDLLVAVSLDHYNLPDRVSGYTVGPLGVDVSGLGGLSFDAATDSLYLSAVVGDTQTNAMFAVDSVSGSATLVAGIGDPGARYLALADVASARPCGVPVDVAWLSASAYTAPPLPPGEESTVSAILDATDLLPGSYDASLCLHSSDAAHRKQPIDVHFVVTGSDLGRIFSAGFEEETR